MAFAHIKTIGRLGIRSFPITVEVDVSNGLPGFTIVGLPDTIVQEAKERIRSAIKNSGGDFPLSRITVNLAPADIRKEGGGFDVPIALGILVASEQIPPINNDFYFYGELGLQGELKATRGTLSFAMATAKSPAIFIPASNQHEAGLVRSDGQRYAVNKLADLIHFFKNEGKLEQIEPIDLENIPIPPNLSDFTDIHGQASAKRALEVAAAGHHNILLAGPPGSGKTLLSRTLPSIMPALTHEQILETTQIYSIAGLLNEELPYIVTAPFRSPHHSASMVSLIGGGNPPRPGEITLAHNGVLFLDEFAELPRGVIEALRQPLEDRVITVARAGTSAQFPAHSLLVAAINPCPCGYKDDPTHPCSCTPQQIVQYQKKLSGPILDRIDIHIIVPAVPVKDLTVASQAESSQEIRSRVVRARQIQANRYKKLKFSTNSALNNKHIREYCQLNNEAENLIERAITNLKLSARGYHKVLKLARTIADLDEVDQITTAHVSEALRYRPLNY